MHAPVISDERLASAIHVKRTTGGNREAPSRVCVWNLSYVRLETLSDVMAFTLLKAKVIEGN